MIQIENLSYAYGRNTVLQHISMKLQPGRIIGLLGENGVGKTTLLTLLCGLKNPLTGSIDADGRKPFDRKPSLLADQFYLPDEVMPLRLSAEAFARERGSFWPNFTMERFLDLLAGFEVEAGQRMDKMSAGQLKKTWIAFGLACHARYYYMDEPTNGLDIPSKAQFRKMVAREMSDEATLVISTHQVRDLEDIIDTVVILESRAVAVNATVEEIGRAIYFDYSLTLNPEALYSEQTASGFVQVLPNPDGLDSRLNLEAFFNAVHGNRERVLSLLSNLEK